MIGLLCNTDVVDSSITAEFFDPQGCPEDFMDNKGDRSSVLLIDNNHDTCIFPFEFDIQRYVARQPVQHPYRRYKAYKTVQISGWNISCHPLQGMAVYSASSEEGGNIMRCRERLPFSHSEQGHLLCSYKCPCHHGCHLVFVELFDSENSQNDPAAWQLCEVKL